MRFRLRHGLGALAFATLLAACATDVPLGSAIGPDQVPLPASLPRVSGGDTAATREHRTLVAAFGGEYKAPALQQFLAEMVGKLGAATDKPSEQYRVTILNSPAVNAFALPNGNIYVTRGLLTLANDTSEAAAVLAHEMAHVTARHASERESLQRRSALLSRVDGEVLNNPIASEAKREQGKLAIASFSRQQELEADQIAVRTLAKAGYDPYGASRFLISLGRSATVRAAMLGKQTAAQAPDITATHPSTPERVQLAVLAARQISAPGVVRPDRARWLSVIDGVTFGEDPAEGVVRGRNFIHPRLGFSFTAPEGFSLENNPQAVIGFANNATELLKLDTVTVPPAAPLQKLLETGIIDGVKMTDVEAISVNGLPGATALAKEGEWTYRVFAVRLGTQVYRIIFAALHFSPELDARFKAAAQSFRRLSGEEARAARPARIALVSARGDVDFANLAARMPGDDKLERFMVLNGLDSDAHPVPGQQYKIVVE
jgi:predicted Zn-dependent protease